MSKRRARACINSASRAFFLEWSLKISPRPKKSRVIFLPLFTHFCYLKNNALFISYNFIKKTNNTKENCTDLYNFPVKLNKSLKPNIYSNFFVPVRLNVTSPWHHWDSPGTAPWQHRDITGTALGQHPDSPGTLIYSWPWSWL